MLIVEQRKPIEQTAKGAAYPGHFTPYEVENMGPHITFINTVKHIHVFAKLLPHGAYAYRKRPKTKHGGWKPVTVIPA